MTLPRQPRALAIRILFLAAIGWIGIPANAEAQCGAPNLVIFNSNGTSWRFCWEMRQREGLVINFADFQAAGDTYKRVLFRGSIAQVFVPYFPGNPRFHDITTATSGLGAGALNLTNTDCPPAQRLTPQVCKEEHDRGLAYKFVGTSLRGRSVTVWISSQLGQYNYITSWEFNDDGSFEPKLGFTGRLQIIDSGDAFEPFGEPVDNPALNRRARNHVHSIYWRLDFDIVDFAGNILTERAYYPYADPNPSFPACEFNYGLCATNYSTPFSFEGADFFGSGQPFTSWNIYNQNVVNAFGRNVGYELVPHGNWAWYGEPVSEPWTGADLWVTVFDPCELLAIDNRPPYIPAECSGALEDIAQMAARGTDISAGADLVVWYKNAFQHLTREEDLPNMLQDTHSVMLVPRSWRTRNPFP